MIQDIAPEKLDISYFPDSAPEADSVVFFFRKNEVLCRNDAISPFPVFGELDPVGELTYLFSVSGRKFFLAQKDISAPEGMGFMNIRQLRQTSGISNAHMLALFTAYHLSVWYSSNRFCGSCGRKTVPGSNERALICPDCVNIIYPRINPAVIVGVASGDRLLITRYASGYAHDALVAGFAEIGEALEDTVRREVMEETGLRVKNIQYYKSQPWGMSGSLLAGFFCEADGDTAVTMDASELKSAVWTKASDIKGQPDNISLTNEMMCFFRKTHSHDGN